VQTTHEAHHDLDDAMRALRRPATWPRERAQVAHWARRLLADGALLAVDVETTGLQGAYAVQITAVDRRGGAVFNEYVQPSYAPTAHRKPPWTCGGAPASSG
jgi:DNA polymerase-3 subunit epsilon